MNDFHPPELILLGFIHVESSRLALSSTVRDPPAMLYNGIGIVFFSVETDINQHIETMREGGDEFFVKTMAPDNLVAAVEAKAKRARILQRLMFRDGLTGLLNRSGFDDHFTKGDRQKQASIECFFLCYAGSGLFKNH